jgi:enoyl-CoA hydratase/carnithine racemase
MLMEEAMINRMVHGEIHELRLNRPPVNALSRDLLKFLGDEIHRSSEQGARAVVLSGREGMFSGGLDVPSLAELDREGLESFLATFFDTIEALADSQVPVAAAITGHCPAGGAVLALCCDWRVMAEGDFTIGLNEVRIGIPLPKIVAELVVRAVGPRIGEALCVAGRLLDPTEALAVGFVDEVVALGEVVSAARRWCENVVAAPPEALAATRALMRRDLVEAIRRHREEDVGRLVEQWFEPPLQMAMRDLVARLKGG